jgi:hypothetical protein
MRPGESYRLRLIHISPDWTARIALLRGDSEFSWRALAKDGAELPPHRQTTRAADFIAGRGRRWTSSTGPRRRDCSGSW